MKAAGMRPAAGCGERILVKAAGMAVKLARWRQHVQWGV